MRISYLGKVSVNDIFDCQMCDQKSKDKYLATPEAVTLVDWDKMFLCKKCARREIGSRSSNKWKDIHEKRTDS